VTVGFFFELEAGVPPLKVHDHDAGLLEDWSVK
jgi:hypothetical protein